MRRDQSKTGSDYRREHNAEMWNRPVWDPIQFLPRGRRDAVARAAVDEQGVGD